MTGQEAAVISVHAAMSETIPMVRAAAGLQSASAPDPLRDCRIGSGQAAQENANGQRKTG
jgi:hypothetical protein